MKVNGLMINASCEDIIRELTIELEQDYNRFLFRRTKSLGANMQFSCPFHAGGTERHPSCGMSRDVQYSAGKVIEAGTVHCFTCGYTAPLNEFISDVFGRKDGGFYGNQWLKRRFVSSTEQVRPKLDLGFSKTTNKTEYNYVSEEELDKYRWIHPYMYERKLTDEIIEMFDIGYDKLNDCITMPVRDMQGRTVFFNRRSTGKKFHHYAESDPKTDFLYGAYELNKYKDYFSDLSKVYITESAINCLTLWTLGIPAVALMGVGGGNQFNLIKQLPFRTIVLALDPDTAGTTAAQKIQRRLKNSKVVYFLNYPQECWDNKWDINDCPELIDFEDLVL